MKIDSATADDIFSVAVAMRPADLSEFLALAPAHGREALAGDLVRRYAGRDDVFCAKDDEGTPIAIGGVIEYRPNVLTLMFFATERLPVIGVSLTRFIKQKVFAEMIASGVHRIECVSMEGHTEAHRWIQVLGLRQEAPPLRMYGSHGETFIQFSWVKDAHTFGA